MSEIKYKIILIGNSGVGKTSFFRKLSTGQFSEKNISTIGIEKKTLDLDMDIDNNGKTEKKKFNISLFDTAGQEKFRAVTRNYYKDSDGIFLLYDITENESFEQVKTWIDSIRESLGKSKESKYVIILIGNKLDLVEEDKENRQVTEDEAKKICSEYNMKWGGEQSVKSIDFQQLIKLYGDYVKEIYKIVGENSCSKQNLKNVAKQKKTKAGCLGNLFKVE